MNSNHNNYSLVFMVALNDMQAGRQVSSMLSAILYRCPVILSQYCDTNVCRFKYSLCMVLRHKNCITATQHDVANITSFVKLNLNDFILPLRLVYCHTSMVMIYKLFYLTRVGWSLIERLHVNSFR